MGFKLVRKREFRLFFAIALMFFFISTMILFFSDPDKITVDNTVLHRGDEGFDEALHATNKILIVFSTIFFISVFVFGWVAFSKREFKFLKDKDNRSDSKDRQENP